ncbi:MAG: DUF1697 domain-containing protein [Bryobacteraceae bacterium]|nr:DUF1697 domain-containing protein [Bryobacteraceae bacterium]
MSNVIRVEPKPKTCVALIRGINVGRAKRVAMADLRQLFSGLGYRHATTLLNSGNVVFVDDTGETTQQISAKLESAFASRIGFSARIIVLTAVELRSVVEADPLSHVATEPSRYLVAFLDSSDWSAPVKQLAGQDWTPEILATGPRAVYAWCPNGISGGRLAEELNRTLKDSSTARNWASVTKLLKLAEQIENSPSSSSLSSSLSSD